MLLHEQFPKLMTFDGMFCDVPYSGDGMCRKAPDLCRRWNSDMGIALNRLKTLIVERGVYILKRGGLLPQIT